MVLAIPLLTAKHRETTKLDYVVVVDCPTDIALERLLTQRGMDRADAEARIRAQITREERVKEADYVLDNSGDRAHPRGRGRAPLGVVGREAERKAERKRPDPINP